MMMNNNNMMMNNNNMMNNNMMINDNRYINPINIENTKKILNQMSYCICKIKNNGVIGNGFFCKIPYKNNTKINVLITSYQIINENYFYNNNKITLFMNDYNEQKIINYNLNRNTYYNKLYNTTIIEVNDFDNINNYLEIDDDNLFGNNINQCYENQSAYILNFLNNGKASVSYGFINQINQHNIRHMCYTESSSNGGPILNLTNNKVVGITLVGHQGTILKYPIEDFINRYQNVQPNMMMNNYNSNMNMNININNNGNNIGMQGVLDMGGASGVGGMNMGMQGMNIGMQGMNIGMQGMNMGMQGMNLGKNQNMGMMDDEVWKKGYKIDINEINNNKDNEEEIWMRGFIMTAEEVNRLNNINIIFKTSQGLTTNMTYSYGTTINEVLNKYLKQVGRPDLIGDKGGKITFLYNATKLEFGDQTTVESKFKSDNQRVTVVDINNIIGPALEIKFNSTSGSHWEMVFGSAMSIDELLTQFFKNINKPELKSKIPKKLCFLFNANKLNPGDKTSIGHFFNNIKRPIVVINDINNLLG